MNRYGEFKNNGWEYHIYNPETPKPWYNYLFNENFHSIISQTGGGFNYAIDPKVNRILRFDNIDNDLGGRYLFIKENKDIWSAGWMPLKKNLKKFHSVFGPGYAVISSEKKNIFTEMKFYVPPDDTIEIWDVKIVNKSSKPKKISIYPFIDIIAGDADLEARYRNIMKLYNKTEYNKKLKTLLFYKLPFPARDMENYAFFMSSVSPSFFETERLKFIGEYRSIETPIALNKENLSNSTTRGEDMIGAFQFNLTIAPGKEKNIRLIIGFAENKKYINKISKKYISAEKDFFSYTKQYWENTLKKLWINTDDEELNRMTNIWGKYQLLGITLWRGTSAYHGTEGGLGYRDLAQDVEGIAGLNTKLTEKKIMNLLEFQYSTGNAVSGFSILEGAWDENPENKLVSGKSDVAVWLPNAVSKYIKETGNINFLNKRVKYLDKGSDTVYNHIIKAVEYISSTTGKHGLPLIKIADWNDAYDMIGRKNKGESVWLGEAVCWAALIVKDIADFINDSKTSKKMYNIYSKMKDAVNKYGWNGSHYIAAYNDYGQKIGDTSIPLNSQTWAIIGKVVPENRLKKVLKAIDSLDTPYGNLLFKPPYHSYNRKIGRVTAFAEGTKENAAVFSHAVAFKVVADCIAGRNNEAYKTIKKLIPTSKAKNNIERYKVEPYVWAEYVIGKGNKYYGQGAFTWNTGTAVWTYIAVTEWILGVKPGFDAIILEPHLPDSLRKIQISRIFRNTRYNITIEKGKDSSLNIDGKYINGNRIPYFNDSKVHNIYYIINV